MGEVSLEWMITENGDRIRGIFRNSMPIFLANEWLLKIFRESISVKTAGTYAERLVVFFRWLDREGIRLDKIKKKDLVTFHRALHTTIEDERYLFDRNRNKAVSDSTRYQTERTAHQFLEWASERETDEPIFKDNKKGKGKYRGLLTGITAEDVSKRRKLIKRTKKKLPKNLNDKEVEVIREWIKAKWAKKPDFLARNLAIFETMLDTGMRMGEIIGLQLDRIDLEGRMVEVPFLEEEYRMARRTGSTNLAFQKSGERSTVIRKETARLINEYITLYRPRRATELGHMRIFVNHRPGELLGTPMKPSGVRKMFFEMNKPPLEGGCALIKHIHPHLMRHTTATSLRKKGVDIRTTQQQMGHEDIATTAQYDHVTIQERRKILDDALEINREREEEWGIE